MSAYMAARIEANTAVMPRRTSARRSSLLITTAGSGADKSSPDSRLSILFRERNFEQRYEAPNRQESQALPVARNQEDERRRCRSRSDEGCCSLRSRTL